MEERWSRTRSYLKVWLELIIAEKRRQTNEQDVWLWLECLFWQAKVALTMPIVLWLRETESI
eukprot:9637549-Lingulodinium_polyedra.AAC.1